MLAETRELLEAARRGGYAVPAFNVHSLDMVPAVVRAAEEAGAPVILQVAPATAAFTGWEEVATQVRAAACRARVPVALHLDHAPALEPILRALHAGFTSLMADGSMLPDEENAAFTRRAVELGHAAGVPVEGEIGHVPRQGEPGWERPEAALTPPDLAERFAAETGVDSLAVAVGTVHGFYRGEPHIDLERLEAIRRRVPVPLVLHGGSGLPPELLGAAVVAGVAKVNVSTELKAAWARALRRALEEAPAETDPRRLLAPALEAVRERVTAFIDALGARGRAACAAGEKRKGA